MPRAARPLLLLLDIDVRSSDRQQMTPSVVEDAEVRLWLDDDLVNRAAPDGWTHVTTAREAIELLDSERVVELSLDHDLGRRRALRTWDRRRRLADRAAGGSRSVAVADGTGSRSTPRTPTAATRWRARSSAMRRRTADLSPLAASRASRSSPMRPESVAGPARSPRRCRTLSRPAPSPGRALAGLVAPVAEAPLVGDLHREPERHATRRRSPGCAALARARRAWASLRAASCDGRRPRRP